MERCQLEHSPIVYHVSGRGQAEWVLLLHAAFVDHRMFGAQIAHFRNQYNILAPDVLGHGKSIHAKRGDGIENMSLWIREILAREKIEKIHIVGVSLGAVLAQDFADRYPEAVQSLACFGGYDIHHFDWKMQRENGAAQLHMMMKAFISIKWFAKANRAIAACTPQAQQAFYELNLQFQKKSLRYLASLGKLISERQIGERAYPLLIGCGAQDIPMELALVKAWKEREPACRKVIFAEAGHCVNMDAPQQFNAVLEAFLVSNLEENKVK